MNSNIREELRNLKRPEHLTLEVTIEATEDDLVALIDRVAEERFADFSEKLGQLGNKPIPAGDGDYDQKSYILGYVKGFTNCQEEVDNLLTEHTNQKE